MKKVLILSSIIGAFSFISCEEHEVIPPPVPIVDLDCECDATILGIVDSNISYSDTCRYSSTKTISTTTLSEAQYQTQIQNSSLLQGIQIEMRSLQWNDDGSNNPTLADWQAFFNNNMTPGYYYDGMPIDNGVIVTWTDPNGIAWTSDTGAVCVSDFNFSWFNYDDDTTGQYMQFDATFDCNLKSSGYGTVDSVKCLTNGHAKSAFRLE